MLTTADLLTILEEQKSKSIKQLAKETRIPEEKLHVILSQLSQHKILNYDSKTGKVTLPRWLIEVNRKIEEEKAATGEVILPKYAEIKIEDIMIGNYTENDLTLKYRLGAKRKEIAICDVG
ncbi:hypothetical protein KEJ45_07305 [Candidatus Bathyarchaeota archaeon]|nr:hypothetical protein [Candidatus Bathyarchaeota archaeon]